MLSKRWDWLASSLERRLLPLVLLILEAHQGEKEENKKTALSVVSKQSSHMEIALLQEIKKN
jgi:hypothetical protein